MSFEANTKQLLSLQLVVPNAEQRTFFSPAFPVDKEFTLSVEEVSGTGRALITVEMMHPTTQGRLQFSIGPAAGRTVRLSGPVRVTALAQNATATLDMAITASTPTTDLIDFMEAGQDLQVAYGDLGSNGGFPQPFYHYAAVYFNGVADIRIINIGGGVAWEVIGIAPDNLLLNQLRIGSNCRLQARRNNPAVPRTASPFWYNRR